MKILVPVKRVVDYAIKVRVKTDGSGVDLADVRMSMNPFDENALEEAVRLREAGVAREVLAVTIGSARSEDVLRSGLAAGADRAMLIEADDGIHADIEPLAVARILAAIVRQESPQMVLAGKQAIDNDMNATGQMLAGLLGWSQATFASALRIEGSRAVVTREVDGGLQTVRLALPSVITADLRLNEPRYASLPSIMKARKKPIEKRTAAEYGVDITPRLRVVRTDEPSEDRETVMVDSVDDLVFRLGQKGVL